MRLRRLSAAGFRGFNTPRTIEFDTNLTLISAPNSHGKTSITEAFEFLIYGQTSKVEHADSKDEYKDSYRNRHFPLDSTPYVEAICEKDGTEVVLRAELDGQSVQRYVDGMSVAEWPFATELLTAARPFVVQHALKSLLLAAPTDRFQGFAQLLGLRDVDAVQQAFVNLCTKPETHLSANAKRLLVDLDLFEGRLKNNKPTAPVAQALRKGPERLEEALAKITERGNSLIRRKVDRTQLSGALVELRNDAAAKVYAGSVRIGLLTAPEQQQLRAARQGVEGFMTEEVVQAFGQLAVGNATDRLRQELNLLGIGIDFIAAEPDSCPLCAHELDAGRRAHIHERHAQLVNQLSSEVDISAERAGFAGRLKQLIADVELVRKFAVGRSSDLINANTPEASSKIKALFGKGHENELFLIAAAGAAIQPHQTALTEAATKAAVAAHVCSDAVHGKSENIAQIETLVLQLGAFLASEKAYDAVLQEISPTLEQPSQVLQVAVDSQAGTTELSLLIEVFGAQKNIEKAVRIRAVLESLKDLRKHIDQAVGQTMEDAFSQELTGAVMAWYDRIRTTGDPDVHFSGFAMERTRAGAFKSRRVRVAAHSYGAELASAVSSLSESKLNALGLCMSIATALRSAGPWGFLILDDPIQSWDDDHEVQFIDIIRRLASDEGRQIVLMSHRSGWIDRVAAGCRSVNGRRYHIGAYSQDGPAIAESTWAPVDERLRDIHSASNDTTATKVRLQQAEEELRIAACQIVAEVGSAKLGREVGAHGLNSKKCRVILTDAGCDSALVDRVIASFGTTDDAHHAPKDYEPNRERIRQYHGALSELRSWLKKQ